MSNRDLAEKVKALAAETGYVACGVAAAEPFREFEHALDALMARFPETRELYEPMKSRIDPRSSAPWVRSIVVCIRKYGKYRIPAAGMGSIGRNYLFDRRHSDCPDHDMPDRMSRGLKGLGLRIARGGVPDRWAAARAGAVRFGKNCFAYTQHGSWINIETWRVDAELPGDEPTCEPACPEGCRACIDSCPTGALVAPFIMRMDRCIAHLTYAAALPIELGLQKKMGKWVYGCDVCQEVCPLNKRKWEELEAAPWIERVHQYLGLEALAAMDQETYERVIHPLFWYIPKDNLERWHSNARRALRLQNDGR